jgi:hypothetical protein
VLGFFSLSLFGVSMAGLVIGFGWMVVWHEFLSAGSRLRCGDQDGAAHRDGQEEPLRQERCVPLYRYVLAFTVMLCKSVECVFALQINLINFWLDGIGPYKCSHVCAYCFASWKLSPFIIYYEAWQRVAIDWCVL